MGDDAHHQSQAAQVTPQTAQLKEMFDGLAARVTAMEAARDRQSRLRELLDDAGYPPELPRRARHAAPKRDRSHLRVIPGGLAAFAPVVLAFHGGLGAGALTAWQWLFRTASSHLRWVLAAAVVGATGAITIPAVTDIGAAPAPALLIAPDYDHDRPPARPLHHHSAVVVVLPTALPAPVGGGS